ncbi:MAG: hypothetical protein R3F59_26965 [Myxococcota bacterium]
MLLWLATTRSPGTTGRRPRHPVATGATACSPAPGLTAWSSLRCQQRRRLRGRPRRPRGQPRATLCDQGDGLALPSAPPGTRSTRTHRRLHRCARRGRDRFVARLQAACDAGVRRGCTELGYAWLEGLVRYPNARRARTLWTSACDSGEPRACTALALDAGGCPPPTATSWTSWRSSRSPTCRHATQRPARLRSRLPGRLGRGLRAARRRHGGRPVGRRPRRRRRPSAAAGRPPELRAAVPARLAAGEAPRDAVLAGLDAACADLPEACEEAAFLRRARRPSRATPCRRPPEGRAARPVRPAARLHRCSPAIGRRKRGRRRDRRVRRPPRSAGDAASAITASAEPFDAAYGDCVVDVLRTAHVRPAGAGPSRLRTTVDAFHGAEVKVRTLVAAGEGVGEGGRLQRAADGWGVPLDACAASRRVVGDPLDVYLEGVAVHDDLRDVHVVDGIDEPEVEQCLVDWLAAQRVDPPVHLRTPVELKVQLLRPRAAPPREEADVATLVADDADGPPVEIEMLVVSVTRSRSTRRAGASPPRSVRSIHREMAEAVARMTHDRLHLHLTFRTIPAVLVTERELSQEGFDRFTVSPGDLPPSVLAAIGRGQYDAVMVWGASPLGFPRSALGVTYRGITVGGATVSTGMVPSRSELRDNPGVPPYGLPLHEWWHQVEGRAADYLQLDTAWPPKNHAVLEVDGERLDPRSWLPNGDSTVIAWYEHVLDVMPRSFWADAWGRGERAAPNLAQRARPTGEEVLGAAALVDTVVDFGAYAVPAAAPGATNPAFGLDWGAPTTVGRVVAHARGDWRDVALEVGEGAGWAPLPAEVTRDGDAWTFAFPPRALERVRVRVAGEVGCSELEAWAE